MDGKMAWDQQKSTVNCILFPVTVGDDGSGAGLAETMIINLLPVTGSRTLPKSKSTFLLLSRVFTRSILPLILLKWR